MLRLALADTVAKIAALSESEDVEAVAVMCVSLLLNILFRLLAGKGFALSLAWAPVNNAHGHIRLKVGSAEHVTLLEWHTGPAGARSTCITCRC